MDGAHKIVNTPEEGRPVGEGMDVQPAIVVPSVQDETDASGLARVDLEMSEDSGHDLTLNDYIPCAGDEPVATPDAAMLRENLRETDAREGNIAVIQEEPKTLEIPPMASPEAFSAEFCKYTRVVCRYNEHVVDAAVFAGVREVDLTGCFRLTYVSALREASVVYLNYCSKITGVSALGKVRELDVSGCYNITDVSGLGGPGQENLSLRGLDRITKVSNLGGVEILNLRGCSQITDVSALGNVKELDLSRCPFVNDVSALGGVQKLDLSHCTGIASVAGLGRQRVLSLEGCHQITDVSGLDDVAQLTLPSGRVLRRPKYRIEPPQSNEA